MLRILHASSINKHIKLLFQFILTVSSISYSLFEGIRKSQNCSSVNLGWEITSKFFFTCLLAFYPTKVPNWFNNKI